MKKTKKSQPWDIKIASSTLSPTQHLVEIRMVFTDNKLREKMKNVTDAYFTVSFKSYWFGRGVKSARVYKSDRPTKLSQPYASHMKYTFDSAEKASLFIQGIERALDIFIMEQILEDKQQRKE